jgi:hypothetical protein
LGKHHAESHLVFLLLAEVPGIGPISERSGPEAPSPP